MATLCTPKLLLPLTPAFGEWLPLLWGSATPSLLLPFLTCSALCLWSPGEGVYQTGFAPGSRTILITGVHTLSLESDVQNDIGES